MAVSLVVWIIFAILCGVLAQNKGRRPWLWVILGLLLGVVALIVLACLSKQKKCPKCKNSVKHEAIVCPNCYHDFAKAARGE